MRTRRKMNRKQLAILIAVAAVALLTVIYVAVSFYFNKRFPFRTTINGIDCSRKTVAEVKLLISETIDPYQLELTDRNGKHETIKGSEIDLQPIFDGSLEKELASRSGFKWPASLFRKTTIELETMVSYDEGKLQNIAENLQCVKESDSHKPVDAHISDYIDGKGYSIIPEEAGAQIDISALSEALHSNIINLQEKLSLDEANCYVQPKVTSEDEALKTALAQLNNAIKTAVTYKIGNNTETLNGTAIHSWLSLTEDNQFVVDEAQAAAYIKGLAGKYDTYGKTRSFTTTYGPTVQLKNNKYGWQIDQSKETAQLLEDIKNGITTSREPAYSHKAKNRSDKDYGDTYVEINLTAQHLYFYKDGTMILESDLRSGHEYGGNATPPGAFSVTYTQRGAVLRGRDYAAPVDFWMPFNGNIGMHDATWCDDFGGFYYMYAGSHGCINLPYESAETIFNNIKAGDPVFVYKLEGTETEKYRLQEQAFIVTVKMGLLNDEITLDSKPTIDMIREAYDALPEGAKQYVENYDQLLNAEAAYAKLLGEQ